ncbi:MAG: HNH endonuclease [Candidatus Competibacteraceae bacterium]|nr:HNH endonuclease [Candidatus Competibacteraceae bacterium]
MQVSRSAPKGGLSAACWKAKNEGHLIDHEIWRIIWKWATRRHPNKGTKWVKDRYFIRIGSRDWIFVATTKDKDGKPQRRTLIKASDTKIMRHIKIKGEANPFDPAQESYFESRLGWKMDNNLKGKTKLLRLWWRQDKECPHCQEKITKETGWNIHHILPKAQGGKDNISNLMLLHPNCHRQIHSQKLEVVKPAPVKGGLDEA